MSAQKLSRLQRAALASGLVNDEQLKEALEAARQPVIGPPAPRVEITDDQLARQLVDMGLVTDYQANQLKAGLSRLTLGPYLVTDWIGEGGMGQVFKAEHQLMGREVALKVLPQSRMTPAAIENFTREIRTQAILDHEHLVRAFDAGHDGNVYYLVTEYIPGTDLRRLVRAEGPLGMRQAASIISQSAIGLRYAHEKGLIHRDVKPGNILVTPEGLAKVSDLGLAGFLCSQTDPRSRKTVGTPDYVSPELIKSPETVTPASDIYSLGCTLYYAVTGKVPFPGGTTRDKARRHLHETPWHPRRFNPNVSEELVEVIADMMAKEPKDRIQTALEVVARLEPWAGELSPIAPPRIGSPWLPPPVPDQVSIDVEQEEMQPTQDALSSDAIDSGGRRGSDSTPHPVASGSQDTQRSRDLPSLPLREPPRSAVGPVIVALAIAIPISMVVGAIIAVVFAMLLQQR